MANKKKSSAKKTEVTKKTEIKKRVPTKRKKQSYMKKNILLVPFVLMAIAIMLLVYLMLGLDFTILTGLILAIILILISMLNNIRNNKRRKKLISFILIIILTLAILGVAAFCAFIIYIKTIADPRFKVTKLNTPEITILYDKDDKVISKLGSEQREKVSYDELPEVLVDAIVATEDSRFFQHNGFDAPRFLKAGVGQVMGNSDAGGASTLSMQVVKNSFTDAKIDSGVAGVIRKFEDIYLAVYKLEKKYTKEEIIEYYVNNHFLGGNIYGVEEAAQSYFGKSVSDLNLSEAATIAGMFKSPNFYRPTANPKNATARRATVLYLMRRHGYINEEQEEMANAIPMQSLTHEAKKEESKYQGYIDTVVEEVKETYGVNPYTTSLKIYTNLNRTKQDAVDDVLSGRTYDWKDEKLDTGVAVLDAETGAIQAIGAGRHRANAASTWNNATDIRRQPGSTAKPLFDYGPGIEYNDWSTGKMFNDAPYHYSNGKTIHNWDNGYYGNITLRRALSASRNIPALKAFQQVDNSKIRDFVTSLGINPELCTSGYTYNTDTKKCVNNKNKLDTQDPQALHEAHSIGAFTGVNPLQMAAAYAAFANGGYYNKPYTVRKIEFRLSGKVEEHKKEKKKVMSDATAFMIASVLQDVNLNGGGTPSRVAVKTGTTNFDLETKAKYHLPDDAIRDSWAIGFSTKTVIGMWYGYDGIDKNHVSHNIPGSIAKDKEFIALIKSGAMESDRAAFKQPASVVKYGSEYYKKGTKPEKTEEPASLAAPGGFKVSYNASSQTLYLSWSAVSRVKDDENYGEFGYSVYRNGTLIGWTTSTSYSITTSDPTATYRVQAGYKGYSGINAGSASNKFIYKVEEPEEPEPEPSPEPSTEPQEP